MCDLGGMKALLFLLVLLASPGWAALLPERSAGTLVPVFSQGIRTGPFTAAQLASVSANDGTELW